MAKEIRIITKSHILPENEDGQIAGYTYPPYTFVLEHYFGKWSIECYNNGQWTHSVIEPTQDQYDIENKFTKLIEAYVEKSIADAPTPPKDFKERLQRLFSLNNIRTILGM